MGVSAEREGFSLDGQERVGWMVWAKGLMSGGWGRTVKGRARISVESCRI